VSLQPVESYAFNLAACELLQIITTTFTLLNAYLDLLVRFLNGVADNLTVAIIFRGLPLQSSIEAPDVCDMHIDGRAGLF